MHTEGEKTAGQEKREGRKEGRKGGRTKEKGADEAGKTSTEL